MKFLTFLGVLLLLCLNPNAQKTIQPLSIGDTVPDITFTHLVNFPSPTANLSDFKGKLVILDFWATWCGSCIASFPKMQQLQTTFKENLQVLLIATPQNGDDPAKIQRLLAKLKQQGKAVQLPVTISDTAFRLFPHQSLPHYVWIKDGKVMAITASQQLTASHIQAAITGHASGMQMKKAFDKQHLYFLDKDAPMHKLGAYGIVLKGRMLNLNDGGGFEHIRKKDNEITGYLFANLSYYYIIQRLATRLLPQYDHDAARIIIDSAYYNETGYRYLMASNEEARTLWGNQHLYTFDVYGPGKTGKELFQQALDLLNSGTPFKAFIETRLQTCYVLKRTAATLQTAAATAAGGASLTLADLKGFLKSSLNGVTPLVDSSGLRNATQLMAATPPDNWQQAITILKQNHITVYKEMVNLPVMVVYPNTKTKTF